MEEKKIVLDEKSLKYIIYLADEIQGEIDKTYPSGTLNAQRAHGAFCRIEAYRTSLSKFLKLIEEHMNSTPQVIQPTPTVASLTVQEDPGVGISP